MASTEFAAGSEQAVIRWSRSLARETLGKTYFKRFCGTSQNSIIRVHTDLTKAPGDTVRYDLRVQDRTDGRHGDSELAGFETPLTFYQESVLVDQLRKAHECRGMSQQRTVHDLRVEARDSLSTWWSWVFDSLMFAYLAGYTGTVAANPECCLPVYGAGGFAGNTVTAPTGVYEYDVTSVMTLAAIDQAVSVAKTVNPRIEPTIVEGQPWYVVVLHPYSVRELRQSTTEHSWTTIQQNAGVRGSKNPIFHGALGTYNQCVLHESEFIPRDAVNPETKNLLLGANAGAFALGNAYGAGTSSPGMFKWTEDVRDYENIKGVGSSCIFGIQGNIFNSLFHGRMVIASDCAAT